MNLSVPKIYLSPENLTKVKTKILSRPSFGELCNGQNLSESLSAQCDTVVKDDLLDIDLVGMFMCEMFNSDIDNITNSKDVDGSDALSVKNDLKSVSDKVLTENIDRTNYETVPTQRHQRHLHVDLFISPEKGRHTGGISPDLRSDIIDIENPSKTVNLTHDNTEGQVKTVKREAIVKKVSHKKKKI